MIAQSSATSGSITPYRDARAASAGGRRNRWISPFAILAIVSIAPTLRAAEPAAAADDRLRAMLRDTTQQLRTAQTDLATAQAAQAGVEAERKSLQDKFEALKKQTVSERTLTDRTIAGLTAQLEEQKATGARLREALEKEKAEHEKAAQAAHGSEEQVAKLTSENTVLQRQVADRQAKNLALFLIGNEILSRYEEFSLGNALSAKEPFVGKARARLENLVQDYQDKLADQRAK
jgi:DNA repair exonuclease SbcCD ATPase subunit